MRLDAFLLADAVSAPPDGKLYIHGAGLTVVRAPAFPFSTPLGIAIRMLVGERELERPHEFTLSFRDPEGRDIHPVTSFKTEPTQATRLEEGEEQFLQVALNFGGLTFFQPGVYEIELRGDGEQLRLTTLPLVLLGEREAAAGQPEAED
jgi:hypothetical protein